MSGTSADGIDAVVARISGGGRGLRAKILAHVHRNFNPALRKQILRLSLEGKIAEICELNFLLGEHFARVALEAIRKARLTPRQITAIGSHGQTVHHLPNARTPSTLAGGQGAPLVPYADWVLFTDDHRPRIVQNIGGIGNLTFLPPRASLDEVLAFDTGPGNMVIDGVVSALSGGTKTFDRAGQWAAKGNVSEKLLLQLMKHQFVRRQPPKTTGREEFGAPFIARLLKASRKLKLRKEDIVATATAFTAATIADAYKRFVFPKLRRATISKLQIILGGGGAKNPTLRRMLRERIGFGEIFTHEDFGVPNAAKEALAFAILAHETLQGRPSNVPNATGASRGVVLGKITLADAP